MEKDKKYANENNGAQGVTEVRFLRIRDVQRMVALSRSKIYELVGEGSFPRPYKPCAHVSAWLLSDVLAWMEAVQRG